MLTPMSLRIRQARTLVATLLLVLSNGCGGGDVVWRSPESRSDDGYWIAKAHTTVYSGFGTGAVETKVEIERSNRGWGESPQMILGFGDGGSDIGLSMRWDGPRHLVVVYKGDPKLLYFQVIKTSGVDISVQNVSTDSQQGVQPSTTETTR
jgi:hypothetical protein